MKRSWLIGIGLFILSIALTLTVYVSWEYMFHSKNYRAYNSLPHHKRLLGKDFSKCVSLNRKLSREYPFSGGGRVNFDQIRSLASSHPGEVIVINLREDPGYYYGDHHISHYGLYLRDGNLKDRRTSKRSKGFFHKTRRWLASVPESADDIRFEDLRTEQDILEEMGHGYVKFDLIRRDFSLYWEFVDRAIEMFESFPANAWIHFHCAGGRGRTTTLSILYDIFRNRNGDSAQAVLEHHYCLGGEDVDDTSLRDGGSWTEENLEGRRAIVYTFVDYMNAPDGYPHKSWSTWLQDHNIPIVFSQEEWKKSQS